MLKRILSIDGGGIKGVFPASFLATVEDTIGDRVGNYFDLIVGTSTGGIIALGLGLGFSATEILGFYEQLGPRVFGASGVTQVLNKILQVGTSKYGHGPLKAALQSLFADRTLGDSRNRLVIPSFNLETGEVHLFKTRHIPRYLRDYKERAVDVALATASAPTFFPTHRSAVGTPLIDGGVWANNPVGVAVVEGIGVLGWQPEEIMVLSVGCTAQPFSVEKARAVPTGLLYWGVKVAEVFMTAQSSASLGLAANLIGHENIIRVNPIMPRGRFGLDKLCEVPSLKGLGDSEARKALPNLTGTFFSAPAEPFRPAEA